jgi:hypothetical protein
VLVFEPSVSSMLLSFLTAGEEKAKGEEHLVGRELSEISLEPKVQDNLCEVFLW